MIASGKEKEAIVLMMMVLMRLARLDPTTIGASGVPGLSSLIGDARKALEKAGVTP